MDRYGIVCSDVDPYPENEIMDMKQHRLVILGGGESGVGAALLGKQKGYDVFLSDGGQIKPVYEKELIDNLIQNQSDCQ